MADGAQRTGPALESMYRFVLWLAPAVDGFPRRQKFLLGDRLQTTALDVLERLIEATYTRDRQTHLAAANLGSRSCVSCSGWRRTFATWTCGATRTPRAPWTRPDG